MDIMQVCRARGAKNLAMNINAALRRSSAVTITGTDRFSFPDNSRTGKTTAVFARVIPMLKANDMETRYFDLGRGVNRKFFSKEEFSEALGQTLKVLNNTLARPFDVLVIDDAYHLFQDKKNENGLFPIAMTIWKNIGDRVDEGRQFVFISAHHPQSGAFDKFLPTLPGSGIFLQSPLIEFCRD